MRVKTGIDRFQTSGLSAVCMQKLKVQFAVGSDGEVSEPLDVNVLSCDTVEQVKEKILGTFKAKFGFSYGPQLRDLCIGKEPVRVSCRTGRYNLPLSLYFFSHQNMRKMALLYLCKKWTPARRSSGR